MGCRVLDPDHCANQADPVAYCNAAGQPSMVCDACRAANDGCVRAAVAAPECAVTGPLDAETPETESATSGDGAWSDTGTTGGPSNGETGAETGGETGDTSGDDSGDGMTPACGDGRVEGDEECDGNEFAGLDCASFSEPDGQLRCHPIDRTITLEDCCLENGRVCESDAACCDGSCNFLTNRCGL